jgi:hypothetical protein
MAITPLRPAATPGRLPRRHRHPPVVALMRALPAGLAVVGAVALILLVLGLLGVHAVTEHLRLH